MFGMFELIKDPNITREVFPKEEKENLVFPPSLLKTEISSTDF